MLDQAFAIANNVALLGWLMLIFIPHRKFTNYALHAGILMALFGIAYSALIFQGFGEAEGGGFGSIDQVRALFASDAGLLAGWIHYLAFDLFVGAWITRDARKQGIRHWIIVLPLIATFMLGPLGFLLYFLIRWFHLRKLTYENLS